MDSSRAFFVLNDIFRASRLRFGPPGLDLCLQDWIWALGMGSESLGCDLSLMDGIWALRLGFEPKAGIWALRLGFGTQG